MKKFAKAYPRVYKGLGYAKTAIDVAHSAYNIASAIATVVNAEHKYLDVEQSTTTDNTTPRIYCLSGMAQGATDITRNGNSILMKQLYLKGYVYREGADTQVRAMVIRDMNENAGTAPTLAQILEQTAIGYTVVSAHNKDNTERFRVLMDKLFLLDTYHPIFKFKLFKKFKVKKYMKGNRASIRGEHCTFTGANATDTGKGHLYFIIVSNQNSSNIPSFRLYSRFNYVDN